MDGRYENLAAKLHDLHEGQDFRDEALEAFYFHKKKHTSEQSQEKLRAA